jgi:hypothetical protein
MVWIRFKQLADRTHDIYHQFNQKYAPHQNQDLTIPPFLAISTVRHQ